MRRYMQDEVCSTLVHFYLNIGLITESQMLQFPSRVKVKVSVFFSLI